MPPSTLQKEASMALSDRDCRHGRQIGKCADCDIDELTALRKQDDALILQLVEALERSSPHTDHEYRFKPEDWMKRRAEAIQAGRARLEGKP